MPRFEEEAQGQRFSPPFIRQHHRSHRQPTPEENSPSNRILGIEYDHYLRTIEKALRLHSLRNRHLIPSISAHEY
jgi:hypothetical protein